MPHAKFVASAASEKADLGRNRKNQSQIGRVGCEFQFKPLLVDDKNRGGALAVLDSYTDSRLRTIEGHEHRLNEVAISPCGQWIASASDDGTIRIWR